MGVGSLINRNDFSGGTQGVERSPANLIEVTGEAVNSFLKTGSSVSGFFLENKQIKKQYEAIQDIEGRSWEDIIGQDYEGDDRFNAIDSYITKKRNEGDDAYFKLKTSSEMKEAARREAKIASDDFRSVIEASKTKTGAMTGSIIGTLGGALSDPVVLASGLGAGLLIKSGTALSKVVAIEAAVGVASETAIQPIVSNWQNEIGNEYTFSDALANIAFAGVASAGLAGLTSLNFKQAFGSIQNKSALMFEAAANSPKTPASIRSTLTDAADYIRVRDETPFTVRTLEAESIHAKNAKVMDETFAARKKASEAEIRLIDEVVEGVSAKADTLPERPYPKPMEELSAQDLRTARSLEALDEQAVNRVRAAEVEQFQNIVKESPDLKIKLDDGVEVRLKDLDQDVKASNQMLDIIRTCAV